MMEENTALFMRVGLGSVANAIFGTDEDIVDYQQFLLAFGTGYERLSERERLVLNMRYGLADGQRHILSEIASEVGVTRERIRQIEVKALRKLRHPSFSKAMRVALFSSVPLQNYLDALRPQIRELEGRIRELLTLLDDEKLMAFAKERLGTITAEEFEARVKVANWGNVSRPTRARMTNCLLRERRLHHIPLEALTDKQLLDIRNFGQRSLAIFRSVFPNPANKVVT